MGKGVAAFPPIRVIRVIRGQSSANRVVHPSRGRPPFPGADVRGQVVLAWKLAYAAEPSAREVEQAVAFVQKQTELFKNAQATPGQPEPGVQALTNLGQALLSANRFL